MRTLCLFLIALYIGQHGFEKTVDDTIVSACKTLTFAESFNNSQSGFYTETCPEFVEEVSQKEYK